MATKIFKPDSCLTKVGCQVQHQVIMDLVKLLESTLEGVNLRDAMLLLHDSIGPASQTVLNRRAQ